MKRPKFFEDLDRSLSGEPEPEEAPCAPIAIVHDLIAKGQAIRAEEDLLERLALETATGAMIAAQLQRNSYEAWCYEQTRTASSFTLPIDPPDWLK